MANPSALHSADKGTISYDVWQSFIFILITVSDDIQKGSMSAVQNSPLNH